MSNYKITAVYVDTCTPDSWPGHYSCHVSVPVTRSTTLGQLREGLKDEVAQSAVMGSDMLAAILGGMPERQLLHHFPEAKKFDSLQAADETYTILSLLAIDAITAHTDLPFSKTVFEDEGESHAYFLLLLEEA